MTESVGALKRQRPTAFTVVRELEEERWSEFVEEHPAASIFHTHEMHRVFSETRHHRPSVWGALDDTGEIVALVNPVTITTLGGPLRPLATRTVAYAGPLLAPNPASSSALEQLLRTYQRQTSRVALFTELRQVTDASSVARAVAACGFEHERHLNYLIDLTSPEDELWGRVAPSARRNIRKARKLHVIIEEAEGPSAIASAYGVLQEVYRRIQVPLPDRSLFDAAYRILGPQGRFKVLIARLDSRAIGVLTLLAYRDVATYWYTGTLREYGTYRAGDLLVWHAVEVARAMGIRTLDLGGAGRPDEPYGVRDFKAKFGGELVDFGRDTWVSAPLRLRLTKTGYAVARKLL